MLLLNTDKRHVMTRGKLSPGRRWQLEIKLGIGLQLGVRLEKRTVVHKCTAVQLGCLVRGRGRLEMEVL